MLENLDLQALEMSKSLLSLKDYRNDGTFSYVDIANLEKLLTLTISLIEKVINARNNRNWLTLNKIAKYSDEILVSAASMALYEYRGLYSKCYFYLTHMRKMTVYNVDNVSLIPMSINLNSDNSSPVLSLRDIYKDGNVDPDMLLDKEIMTFYKYFHTGQTPINDAEIFTYSYTLLAKTGTKNELPFYDFLKNVGLLYSSFVTFDRLFQLQTELKYYHGINERYLAENTIPDSTSWNMEPRKGNLEDVKTMLEDKLSDSDNRRLSMIINKHLDYLNIVKNLDDGPLGA